MNRIKEIIIYTNNRCSYCHKQIEWMKNVGIPFEIKEISHNEMFMKEFISFGGKGTPFTIIKDDNTTEKVLGFNQDKLIKVLGLP